MLVSLRRRNRVTAAAAFAAAALLGLGASAAPSSGAGRPGDGGEKVPKYLDVQCTACSGCGLAKEIGCATCRATGYVEIDPCAKCGGDGRVEFNCFHCKGSGSIVKRGKETECRLCKGKGHPACLSCRGKGTIPRPNPGAAGYPTKSCQGCDGTGFEQHARCIICAGRGKIEVSRVDPLRPESLGPWVTGVKPAPHAKDRLSVPCPFCGGDGEGPPLCRRCQGKAYAGPTRRPGQCAGCYGTGHGFIECRACRGKGYVRDME